MIGSEVLEGTIEQRHHERIYLFQTGFDTKSSSGNLNGQNDKKYRNLGL